MFKSVKLRRRKIIACTGLAVLCTLTILNSDLSPNSYSEHYIEINGKLASAGGKNFNPPSKSIFFHETSSSGKLSSRQACAVESAARAHPDWQINVLFVALRSNFTLKTEAVALLKDMKMSNIKLSSVHIEKYATGTPLESLVSGGALNRSRWRVSHSSDVLRYLSLYKFGGVYLDLDVVVAKPFDSLARNWAARENERSVAAGALAFSRDKVGREVANATVSDMKLRYRGDMWGHNGPGVITRVLTKRCVGVKPTAMSAATCNGFEVYEPRYVFPIHFKNASLYFKPGEIDEEVPYVFHVWNKLTSHLKVHPGSPYAKLARKYCPNVYKLHEINF